MIALQRIWGEGSFKTSTAKQEGSRRCFSRIIKREPRCGQHHFKGELLLAAALLHTTLAALLPAALLPAGLLATLLAALLTALLATLLAALLTALLATS
jgi:hypothetical protein